MWRTRVGYAGGVTADPIYRRIGDHTECFQLDFAPDVVSYDELLDEFWSSHNPTRPAYSTQYASLILAHDADQMARAELSRDRLESILQRPVLTRIELLERFYVAEDYHQKYYLRQDRVLMNDFRAMFGQDEAAFRESVAAARANGFVAGEGTRRQLDAVLDELGLSDPARADLVGKLGGRGQHLSYSAS